MDDESNPNRRFGDKTILQVWPAFAHACASVPAREVHANVYVGGAIASWGI